MPQHSLDEQDIHLWIDGALKYVALLVTHGVQICRFLDLIQLEHIQSDPDLPGPDLPEPRFTGGINFLRYRKLTIFDPDIPGTPIYRAKSFPPSIPVNRGPTVLPYKRNIKSPHTVARVKSVPTEYHAATCRGRMPQHSLDEQDIHLWIDGAPKYVEVVHHKLHVGFYHCRDQIMTADRFHIGRFPLRVSRHHLTARAVWGGSNLFRVRLYGKKQSGGPTTLNKEGGGAHILLVRWSRVWAVYKREILLLLLLVGPRFTGMLGERILPGKSRCPVYRVQISLISYIGLSLYLKPTSFKRSARRGTVPLSMFGFFFPSWFQYLLLKPIPVNLLCQELHELSVQLSRFLKLTLSGVTPVSSDKSEGTKVISALALVGVGAGIKSLSHLVN
eukprot:sb/3465558/